MRICRITRELNDDRKVDELRAISEHLFSHLHENGVSEIAVEPAYYWDVPKDVRYDPANEPAELSMHQLPDDRAELHEQRQHVSE